jgi:tyrosyl-tRNA synthetase
MRKGWMRWRPKQIVPGYIGFDATAPSLHVGNLVSDHDAAPACSRPGHKPVVLMGGGTTRIGDPTGQGRESARC